MGVPPMTSQKPPPPAIEAAYRILAEHGPLSAADLKGALRSQGFAKSIESLSQLADRFPQRFQTARCPSGPLSPR
ncbi:hypothetical protein I546_0632 [Mycobacterium kansasii 732]|nr:hypothetical protein I546_0632 [Mycobacterium kansasii 732]